MKITGPGKFTSLRQVSPAHAFLASQETLQACLEGSKTCK